MGDATFPAPDPNPMPNTPRLRQTLRSVGRSEEYSLRRTSETRQGTHDVVDSVGLSSRARVAARQIDRSRPSALRSFDQIAMLPDDLARQAIEMCSRLTGTRIAFVGDHDGASAMQGLLMTLGYDGPLEMHVLDFDERILNWLVTTAHQHGFENRLFVHRYNVFDAVPEKLRQTVDWFYVNPPYGSRNAGESACLFIARGLELCRPTAARGCGILPNDSHRLSTIQVMRSAQRMLLESGMVITETRQHRHRYALDDDPLLTSAVVLAEYAEPNGEIILPHYCGRQVEPEEIPWFYGRGVEPPYPRFIRSDGTPDFDWLAA